MKQNINLGSVVDDGTGDYLRQGGQKINSNFDELFDQLGDGDRPFPAGAWKVHSVASDGSVLEPEFGSAWNINTTGGSCSVNLPKGTGQDYGKVIKLRDVWSSWRNNPVTIFSDTGDTIKGSGNPFELFFNDQDIELVYTSPGKWEFIDNKLINRITVSDVPTVAKREFLAAEGQTDFTGIFSEPYDLQNVEVYHRGNLLYFGDGLSDDSDFGSMPDPNDPSVSGLAELDGATIRLRNPASEGDTVIIVSYSDNLASSRTSYNSFTVKVFEESEADAESVEGQVLLIDGLSDKKLFTLEDFGRSEREHFNPFSIEVYVNGVQLTQAGTAGQAEFTCEGALGSNESECVNNGGSWVPSGNDFTILRNSNGKWDRFYVNEPFENGDIVTVKWFDNQIGTLLDWDGADGIRERVSDSFLNTEQTFDRQGKIIYTDTQNPNAQTAEQVPGVEENIRHAEIGSLLESIYPIGTIYENANNPNNPAEYMGFGEWVRFGTSRMLVGWNPQTSPFDTDFGLNNNDLDENQVPRHTAGGTGGSRTVQLSSQNIPQLQSNQQALVVDPTGDVIIGACQQDPDEEGPAIRNYREQQIIVNEGNLEPSNLNALPPYITVHRWVRVG